MKWKTDLLGNCVNFLSGGTPSKKKPEYWNGKIPWISCKDMKVDYLYNSQDYITDIGSNRLQNFPIDLPPLPTQNKIASILSAYDDLIENNTRRIKILETMAQTIYQEWFVKFRFPGHERVKWLSLN